MINLKMEFSVKRRALRTNKKKCIDKETTKYRARTDGIYR